jgi:hypothetical protein
MSKRKDHEARLIRRAREIAASGRHIGWFYVAHELRNLGEPLALQVLEKEPIRSELDRTCSESAKRKWGAPKV